MTSVMMTTTMTTNQLVHETRLNQYSHQTGLHKLTLTYLLMYYQHISSCRR